MKRRLLGAIVAIMSVGIGPAMLAGPSAVLAQPDHPDQEEGGGGAAPEPRCPDPAHCIEDLLKLPAFDSVRDDSGVRILDLPALTFVGPAKPSGAAVGQQVETQAGHVHHQNCCGDLIPPRDLSPPTIKVEAPTIGQVKVFQSEITPPTIDLVEDIEQDVDVKVQVEVR